MITCLIRTHPGREVSLQAAINSAKAEGCEVEIFYGHKTPGFEYNLFCNELKQRVNDGFFFFLDSDDFVIPGAIEKIYPHLEPDRALIVQMLRNGKAKPAKAEIVRGQIGMPCIILHHSQKNLADIPANEYGDYDFIKAVTDLIPWKFLKVPLVNAGKRSHGK